MPVDIIPKGLSPKAVDQTVAWVFSATQAGKSDAWIETRLYAARLLISGALSNDDMQRILDKIDSWSIDKLERNRDALKECLLRNLGSAQNCRRPDVEE